MESSCPCASKGLLNHFKQLFLLPAMWSPLVEWSICCPVLSCPVWPGLNVQVCPFNRVHKERLYHEITNRSTFKTQFSVKNRKVIHEKMLVMHQISTLQLAKQTKNTNFYFFRISEKSIDCHFKTIWTMQTPKNHNSV